MLYIEANGGGTHITSVAELVALTKVSLVCYDGKQLPDLIEVGYSRRGYLHCHNDDAQNLLGCLLRTHCS